MGIEIKLQGFMKSITIWNWSTNAMNTLLWRPPRFSSHLARRRNLSISIESATGWLPCVAHACYFWWIPLSLAMPRSQWPQEDCSVFKAGCNWLLPYVLSLWSIPPLLRRHNLCYLFLKVNNLHICKHRLNSSWHQYVKPLTRQFKRQQNTKLLLGQWLISAI